MRPDLIRIAVILSLAAIALIPADVSLPEIKVPGAAGSMVLRRRTGMLPSLAGNTLVGCRILAPKYASSAASSKDSSAIDLVPSTTRGSLLCIPSIAVHIVTAETLLAAQIDATE